MDNYIELSEKYKNFIYDSYNIEIDGEEILVIFNFFVEGLCEFHPTIRLKKFEITDFTKNLVFHIGLVELISYWKCTCSKNVIIKAGYLNDEQINFFKKLYFNGLGELFYRNSIDVSIDNFMNIKIDHDYEEFLPGEYHGVGNLIPVGGGKDSIVTMELLRDSFDDNDCFIINPKGANINTCKTAGYDDSKIFTVKRTLDSNMLDLNAKGFINGHTPFSSLIAFISLLAAYVDNKKYIVLSNESSANEATVAGTSVNHQYSKTYEFENDFNNYISKFFKINIKYFSLLRPLTEYQIAMIFSKYPKYFKVFKSCNLGSKNSNWNWCCDCGKCLFVYSILSPFIKQDTLTEIFGQDLFDKEDLLDTFLELLGYSDTKPFECVGTYQEMRYAVSKKIDSYGNEKLPFLLKYYKDNYSDKIDLHSKLECCYDEINNLDEEFVQIIRRAIDSNFAK